MKWIKIKAEETFNERALCTYIGNENWKCTDAITESSFAVVVSFQMTPKFNS